MTGKGLLSLNFRHFPSSALLAVLLVAAPARAWAWGAQGHEIVAAMALRELTPAARGQVAHLLGSEAMMIHDANWADEVRDQRRDTGSWHYVNIPLVAPGYDARRDCPRGDCVVAQIGNEMRLLSDRRAGDRARAEALRFLIHFVADIHQPLHAADDGDRGGNDVHVAMGRERASLHKVWDADVVQGIGLDLGQDIDTFSVVDGVARSVTPAQRKAWMQGTPAGWADESHAIARDHIYPPLEGRRSLRLSRDYAGRESAVAQIQLARAGLRLAWLLNKTLR
jgi:hypothetical protein